MKKNYFNSKIAEELINEYKKTITSLLIRLAKKEKELNKIKENLKK